MISVETPIDERVMLLKKLRETLLRQRDKFRNYLNLLEKEEAAIIDDDMEKLEQHIQLEQSIIQEIYSIQRVINPLEDMYRVAFPEKEATIPELKISLEKLKGMITGRNLKNRNLLKERMENLRLQIKNLPRAFTAVSPYANIGVPSMVDISS
ncbi:hypothetical protein ES705_28430 [subsurface metagenome]